ncbi:MAG: hypothetical protein CMF52_00475 [Legionellales bacterium]|nr:hypothetical protein [Legionellales bacterium]
MGGGTFASAFDVMSDFFFCQVGGWGGFFSGTIKYKTMPKKPKCAHCKKKLSLVEQTIVCKCNKSFCSKHRLFTAHQCIVETKTTLPEAATFKKIIKI